MCLYFVSFSDSIAGNKAYSKHHHKIRKKRKRRKTKKNKKDRENQYIMCLHVGF